MAPIWGGAGGGSAMGSAEDRKRFVEQVRKACAIGREMRDLGIRPTGGIRIDSSVGVEAWDKDPEGNAKLIAKTFSEAADIAEDHDEFLVCEGEICWGGMHSWREMVKLLETVDRPGVVGYQADMAHSMLYTLGYNAEADRILPKDYDWSDKATPRCRLSQGRRMRSALDDGFPRRAERRRTVFGSGDHEKTGRHCQVDDPNGRLDVLEAYRLLAARPRGQLPTRRMRHICWDGCMFPNSVMESQETWNKGARRHDQGARGAWLDGVGVPSPLLGREGESAALSVADPSVARHALLATRLPPLPWEE